ncbi:MAG TPA: hypothetical protein EYP74_06065 [Anaerolineales bacterium]|nr:hypothetical protein [Anaerolineales bacterium]
MKKSALIIGGFAFVLSLVVTLISPFLLLCMTLFLGIVAGYITGIFEPTSRKKEAIQQAAKAGLFAGIGMLVGQVFGAIMNGFLVGPEGAVMVFNSFGMSVGSPSQMASFYWTILTVSTACISLFNIVLMAGFGALGGLLWWLFSGKESHATTEIVE